VVPAGTLCNGVFCDPRVGIINIPTKCPSACSGCDPKTGCQQCPGAGLSAGAKAGIGIGAGVIAGIVIGAVVFLILAAIGSKKGYDAYMNNKNNITGAQENPMYNDSGRRGNNPFYTKS